GSVWKGGETPSSVATRSGADGSASAVRDWFVRNGPRRATRRAELGEAGPLLRVLRRHGNPLTHGAPSRRVEDLGAGKGERRVPPGRIDGLEGHRTGSGPVPGPELAR